MNPEIVANIASKLEAYQAKHKVTLSPEQIRNVAGEIAKKDPVTWGMLYRNLRGEPYRFSLPTELRGNKDLWNKHRPFLKQMLFDQAQNKCYEKSRQCGASESSVTEVLWFLDTHKATKALYVFPTLQQMQDFANSRIDACLSETPYLDALRGKVDNVGMKGIGSASYLFMRSGQTSRLGEGVDADALFVDEKDRMSDKIEAAFEQSLSGSRFKLLREFSTPTLPGVGIDKSFQSSCKYYWFVRCESGHQQTLNMENIGQNWDLDPTVEVVPNGTFYLKCKHKDAQGYECPSKINRWDGEWVPYYNDDRRKTHAGYHINQLACAWISPDRMMQQKLKYRFNDTFSNYVLGEPFASNEGLITEDQLEACRDGLRTLPHMRRPEYTAVVAGIDWGYLNWCVVLGRRPDGRWDMCGMKYIVDDANPYNVARDFATYLHPFNPNYIVADLGYGRDRCMELQREFPQRVFACTYTTNTADDKTFNPMWNEGQWRVSVNRTAHLRNMLQFMKLGKIRLPGTRDDYQLFYKHLLNLALIHIEEENPNAEDLKIVERIGKKGDDHYAHAMAYACLAVEKMSEGGSLSWEFLQSH